MSESQPSLTESSLLTNLDTMPLDAVPQHNLGIDNIPIEFSSVEALEFYVDNLLFFDENLHIKQELVNDVIDLKTPALVFLQFNQEFWVVQRLLTIQKYTIQPVTTKKWFYDKITSDKPNYPDEASEILKLSRLGSIMSKAEWEMYKTVFDKLFELHQEKLATHPIPLNPSDN